MPRYSAGWSHVGVNTANKPMANLSNTGTVERLSVVEIGVEIAVAPTNAPLFALTRATARGTNTTTLAGQPHDAGDGASVGSVDSVWSADPTFSTTAFLRIAGLAVTAGGLIVWTFYDKPIMVDKTAASGLTVFNVNASGASTGTFAGYFCWEE